MTTLRELGNSVRQRRTDMGLTQVTLAQLSGLSRATISQIENGGIRDLSLTRTARLLGTVGLKVQVSPARDRHAPGGQPLTPKSALALAAQTASVSLRQKITADQVHAAFRTGTVEPDFLPHVYGLLDEAPVAAAHSDSYPTVRATQAAKCSPASRTRPLGGGCGSKPR